MESGSFVSFFGFVLVVFPVTFSFFLSATVLLLLKKRIAHRRFCFHLMRCPWCSLFRRFLRWAWFTCRAGFVLYSLFVVFVIPKIIARRVVRGRVKNIAGPILLITPCVRSAKRSFSHSPIDALVGPLIDSFVYSLNGEISRPVGADNRKMVKPVGASKFVKPVGVRSPRQSLSG